MGKVLHIHKNLSLGPQHPGKSYGCISTPTTPAMDGEGADRSQESAGHSSCSRPALGSVQRFCLEK